MARYNDQPSHPIKQVLFFLMIGALVAGGYYRQNNLKREAEAERKRLYVERLEIMGTYAEVRFWEEDKTKSEDAAKVVWQEFNEVNRVFNNYVSDSELTKLNNSAFEKPFACSSMMWELLMHAKDAYSYTDGVFDITAGPIIKTWDFYGMKRKTLPTPDELEKAQEKVGFDKLLLDESNKTVQFKVEGMYLDFGGIAKGYALDKALIRVHELGLKKGVLDLGGNMLFLEVVPTGRSFYKPSIQDPRSNWSDIKTIGYVPLKGMSIASSGNYNRYMEIDGNFYSHIINPKTAMPVQNSLQSTVVHESAMIADILSTASFILGVDKYLDWRKEFGDVHILLIQQDVNGEIQVYKKPKLENLFHQIKPVEKWDTNGKK